MQTEYLPESTAIICGRRPRSQNEPRVWAFHVLSVEGDHAPFARLTGVSGSELTGPAFSPDGLRLYVSSQRSPGRTYEISGPFRATAGGGTTTTTVATTTDENRAVIVTGAGGVGCGRSISRRFAHRWRDGYCLGYRRGWRP